jgi:hypothetical protein
MTHADLLMPEVEEALDAADPKLGCVIAAVIATKA